MLGNISPRHQKGRKLRAVGQYEIKLVDGTAALPESDPPR